MNCFIYEVYYERLPIYGESVRVTESAATGSLSTFGPNLQLHLAYGGPLPATTDPHDVTVKVLVPAAQRRTTVSVHTGIDEARVDTAVDEVATSHGLSWKRIASRSE